MRASIDWLLGKGDPASEAVLGPQLVPILRDALVVTAVMTLAFAALMLATGLHSGLPSVAALLAGLLFWPLFFRLLRRQIIRPIAVALMVICCAIALVIAFRLGTVRVLQLSGVMVGVVIGTLLLGRAAGFVATALAIGGVWIGAALEIGAASSGDTAHLTLNQAASFSFFALLLYVLLLLIRRHLLAALQQAEAQSRERAAALQALGESEAKFATLFRDSPVALALVSGAGGLLIDANPRWFALTGLPESARGQPLGTMLGQQPEVLAAIGRVMAGEAPELLPLQLRGATGLRHCELVGAAAQVAGQAVWVLQFIDTTERHAADLRQRESDERFATAFELSPDAWTLHDFRSGAYIAVNRAWEVWSGYRRDEAIGATPVSLGLLDSDTALREIVARLRSQGGQADALPVFFRRRNGEQRRCAMSARIVDMDSGRYLITSTRDVSDEWAAQQALEALNQRLEDKVGERTRELESANRELLAAMGELSATQDELVRKARLASLGAMVAGVAHELNTPIGNGVMLASTLTHATAKMREAFAAGTVRRSELGSYLATCDEASHVLSRNLELAHDLIASFKQVAADPTGEVRQRFRLQRVLEDSIAAMRPALRKSAIALTLQAHDDAELDSYPAALGRVLAHLLDNACLHAFAPGQAGNICIETRLRGAHSVDLTVTDDGCGIPMAHQSRVFDPFFTTRMGQGGSGPGLHIVFTLVTRVLGGTISLESAPGAGSRFVLTLPLRAPEAADEATHGPSAGAQPLSRSS